MADHTSAVLQLNPKRAYLNRLTRSPKMQYATQRTCLGTRIILRMRSSWVQDKMFRVMKKKTPHSGSLPASGERGQADPGRHILSPIYISLIEPDTHLPIWMRMINSTFRRHFSGGASACKPHYLWASRRSALPRGESLKFYLFMRGYIARTGRRRIFSYTRRSF
jgi:hypothetical protein